MEGPRRGGVLLPKGKAAPGFVLTWRAHVTTVMSSSSPGSEGKAGGPHTTSHLTHCDPKSFQTSTVF